MITIATFPLAPSANESYFSIGKFGKQAPTAIHRAFMKACKTWHQARPDTVEAIRRELNSWIDRGEMIRVDAYFVFERSRLWTKDGRPQKIDANNRLKPALDGLVSVLEIDDLYFWSNLCEKVQASFGAAERSVFVLSPTNPRNDLILFHELGVGALEAWPPVLVEKPAYRRKSKRNKFRR